MKYRMTRKHRFGVTLVELLAVCAIIGILAGMALPAIARAINRSRLTQCANNQSQVALAMVNHNNFHGYVPGWLNLPPSGSGSGTCTWTVPLLPYLGRTDIYDMWPLLPNNPTIDTLVCPSNRPAAGLPYPVVHYTGNVGCTGTNPFDGVFLNLTGTGVDARQATSLEAVAEADGTSTTLAFAEKAASDFLPHTWIFARNVSGTAIFGSGTTAPPVFGVSGSPLSPVINNPSARTFAPSSVHGRIAVVAFCDGRTTFLSDNLQPYEYGQLLTPMTRWNRTADGTYLNMTNSGTMRSWLLREGQPYLLDEKALKP